MVLRCGRRAKGLAILSFLLCSHFFHCSVLLFSNAFLHAQRMYDLLRKAGARVAATAGRIVKDSHQVSLASSRRAAPGPPGRLRGYRAAAAATAAASAAATGSHCKCVSPAMLSGSVARKCGNATVALTDQQCMFVCALAATCSWLLCLLPSRVLNQGLGEFFL